MFIKWEIRYKIHNSTDMIYLRTYVVYSANTVRTEFAFWSVLFWDQSGHVVRLPKYGDHAGPAQTYLDDAEEVTEPVERPRRLVTPNVDWIPRYFRTLYPSQPLETILDIRRALEVPSDTQVSSWFGSIR